MNAQPQKIETELSSLGALPLSGGDFFNFQDLEGTFPSFRAIAGGLAKQNRWLGATIAPYSVAQHSCHIADVLRQASDDPAVPLYGLLHDSPETLTGDLAQPVKCNLMMPIAHALLRFESSFTHALYSRLGAPLPNINQMERVKREDARAAATEWRDLLMETYRPFWAQPPKAEPWSFTLKPWGWEKAEQEWLNRLVDLTARCNLRNPL